MMPPMAAAVGTAEDVRNVANYVLSLSGSAHNSVAAQLGKPKFVVCAACHGPEGKGNQALGAPNLTDKIWLHGWGEAGHRRDDQQRQDQRHAGARRAPDTPSRSTCWRPTSGACRRPRRCAAK